MGVTRMLTRRRFIADRQLLRLIYRADDLNYQSIDDQYRDDRLLANVGNPAIFPCAVLTR